jgi:hypothetical protein
MVQTKWVNDVPITSWRQFTQIVRSQGKKLLKRLDEFPNAILIAGCQRSGTTMLARIITQSAGMTNYWFGEDDELDAALILSGYVEHTPQGRYCFQTTYVDECYQEYFEHDGQFKIIWVIRNPYSVVTSLIYNWRPNALVGTFARCATNQLNGIEKRLYSVWGPKWINRARQASLLYRAKTSQMIELVDRLGHDKISVVDYDDLVLDRDTILRQIYKFVGLSYNPEYSQQIHNKSIDKKSRLSEGEKRVVKSLAVPIYQEAQLLRSISLHDQTPSQTIPV